MTVICPTDACHVPYRCQADVRQMRTETETETLFGVGYGGGGEDETSCVRQHAAKDAVAQTKAFSNSATSWSAPVLWRSDTDYGIVANYQSGAAAPQSRTLSRTRQGLRIPSSPV